MDLIIIVLITIAINIIVNIANREIPKRVAKFEKVSFEEYKKSLNGTFGDKQIKKMYNELILPKRSTIGSAGYDFFYPNDLTIKPNETVLIPTGVRVKIKRGWVLNIYPRSSLGFKYRLQLNNTVGIIDSDYYISDNEGHIFIKFTNDTNENKTVNVEKGKACAQGVFCEYGITVDDVVSMKRNGGVGSTDK